MSDIKTATIDYIDSVRPYEGQYGKTYYFQLSMSNGDTGSIGKKKEDALKIGDSLTYTLEEGERGNKIKEVQQTGYSGGFNGDGKTTQKSGNESFALSYSKDVICAMVQSGRIPETATSAQITDTILATANKFKDWLNENKS